MSYSQFTTISKAKKAFDLTVQEGGPFFPTIAPIVSSTSLSEMLAGLEALRVA